MTTRGIFVLAALIAGCSSTTATYADRDEEAAGGATAVGASSTMTAKAMGAVGPAASGGSSVVPTSGGSASEAVDSAGGATSSSSSLDLPAAGGSHDRFSFPAQLPASGGSDSAGGSAAGGSSARMLALPAGAAGLGSVAGSAAVAGAAGTVERAQLTADPKSLDQYWTANKGPYCSTLYTHPSDMCEPVDPTAAPATWTWRAKRGTGNIALDACLPQADEVCGGYSAASICGAEYVLEDGTCGPTAQYEKACAAVDAKYRCFVACLACVQKDDPDLYKFRSRCESALQGVQSGGITCPTY